MLSVTVKGKVCINDEINNLIGCINIEPIAIPIDTIVSGKHSIEHEILKFLECLSHLCFVHDGIFAQIGADYKRPCDTLTNCPQAAPILNKKCKLRIRNLCRR